MSDERKGDDTDDLDFSLLLSPVVDLLLTLLCGVVTPVRERA